MNKYIFSFILFSITLNAYAVDYETEPNGSKEDADPIFFNTTLNGRINGSDDADWYSFDVVGNDVLTLTVEDDRTISVYDDKGNSFLNKRAPLDGYAIGIGEAGTYYVVVTEGFYIGDYGLTISLESRTPHGGEYMTGKQECISDPASCGITVSSEDLANVKQEAQKACKANPTSCGIELDGEVAAAVIGSDLSLHVDKAQYNTLTGTQILWVDLTFGGANEAGDLTWILSNYGEVE